MHIIRYLRLQQVPKAIVSGSLSNMQLDMSACAMPARGANDDVCNLENFQKKVYQLDKFVQQHSL
jgi:hypothetical protein